MEPLRGIYGVTRVITSSLVLPIFLRSASGSIKLRIMVAFSVLIVIFSRQSARLPTKKGGHASLFSPYLPHTCHLIVRIVATNLYMRSYLFL